MSGAAHVSTVVLHHYCTLSSVHYAGILIAISALHLVRIVNVS